MHSDLQKKVYNNALSKLKHYPWFQGVCVDTLPKTDKEILEKGFDTVVENLVDDTIYWDGV